MNNAKTILPAARDRRYDQPSMTAIKHASRPLVFTASLCLFLTALPPAFADVPVPARVTNPVSVEEAWNVIRLSLANVSRLLNDGRVDEVAEQIALCSPSLRLLAQVQPADGGMAGRDEPSARAFRSINLIAQNSMSGNLEGARAVFAELKKTLATLMTGVDKKFIEVEVHHCLSHGDVISLQPGQTCTVCNGPLVPRRIPYSFVFVKQEKPVTKLERLNKEVPKEGKGAKIGFKLSSEDGSPATPADMIISHAQPVHVFLVAPGVRDLKWIIPTHLGKGEYEFPFTPASGGVHRLWISVIPASTGLQEYVSVDLPCEGAPPPAEDIRPAMSAKGGKAHLDLSLAGQRRGGVLASQLQILNLLVKDSGDQPLSRLEPWMTAFVQIIALSEDGKTLFQLHPLGGDILLDSARGGPRLSFKIYPPQAGFMRLFCFLKLDGTPLTIPLGMEVQP
jgi:hypothetical protein